MSTRVTQYRADIKKEALLHVPIDYKLTYGDTDQIDGLLSAFAYIYPFDSKTVRLDVLQCTAYQAILQDEPIGTLPFQHPAIIRILSDQWFKAKDSLGRAHRCYFKADQLPDSMGALAATAVSVSFIRAD
jgi:hypothetical protein